MARMDDCPRRLEGDLNWTTSTSGIVLRMESENSSGRLLAQDAAHRVEGQLPYESLARELKTLYSRIQMESNRRNATNLMTYLSG